jgi:Transposase
MIAAMIERCAGVDVGKKSISVCLMIGPADQDPQTELRTYGTANADLERLRQWLVGEHCTHVALESTGSYWKPIFNVLEDSLTVVLANAEDVKGRRGHKTDPKDSWWLAHLLRHAMIRPSFIPPRAVRELRDLTGFVAKIRRRKNVWSIVPLRSEQTADELHLRNGIVLRHPPHSAFSHHVHRLDSAQRPPCCPQRAIALGQPRSAFHIAMTLLHHVV